MTTKKYSKKNTWQIMNNTGFGVVRMSLKNGVYVEVGKKGLTSSGLLKKKVLSLLQNITVENVLMLSKRYDVEVFIVPAKARIAA